MMRDEILQENTSNDIAIISMNVRFPSIHSLEDYWEVLEKGKENTFVSEQDISQNRFIRTNSSIADAGCFDYRFFGYTKKEALIMDPQHRMFLECAWELMEKAGYNTHRYPGLIGLYAGVSTSTYLLNNILKNEEFTDPTDNLQIMIGNDKDHLSMKVAYKMNLKGPCITVQSACSTSAVAIHMACESLLSGQCDMAIAGGVTINFPQKNGYLYLDGGIVAKDGHIRAFDQSASGTVYSDGLGMVLLKPLPKAVAEGDHIYAVIKGSAINVDSMKRAGYTAPSSEGQERAIEEALQVSDIHPEEISYIEAHGSGTPLGDSIELDALCRVFGKYTKKTSFCSLGAVKTNIGHTEMASGAAGVIKTALALEKKKIPPCINYMIPNQRLAIEDTPFYRNAFLADWHVEGKRNAGVSSFGLGGTNAHIILQEAPETTDIIEEARSETLIISAGSKEALAKYLNEVCYVLQDNPQINLNHLAYTFKVGRVGCVYRKAISFSSLGELTDKLKDCLKTETQMTPIERKKMILCIGNDGRITKDSLRAWIEQCRFLDNMKDQQMKDSLEHFYTARIKDKWVEEAGARYLLIKILSVLVEEPIEVRDREAGRIVERLLRDEFSFKDFIDQGGKDIEAALQRGEEEITQEEAIEIIIVGENGNNQGEIRENIAGIVEDILCKCWQNGSTVRWELLYEQGKNKRLQMPTYPFERQQLMVWPEAKKQQEKIKDRQAFTTLEAVTKKIERIWCGKLGNENITEDDNFFELGGNSLIMMQVVHEVNEEFFLDLPLEIFYDHLSVAELSEAVFKSIQGKNNNKPEFPELIPDHIHKYEPFPLTDVQAAYWVGKNSGFELGNVSTHMYFETDIKKFDRERFESAFGRVIRRHDMLRAVVLPNGTQQILEMVPDYHIETKDVSQNVDMDLELSRLRNDMSHQIFDSAQWPLFDIKALKISEDTVRLHISIDLLIVDAWSLELILKELSTYYEEPDIEFNELEISFRDYVIAVKELEKSEKYDKAKEYWRERIKTMPKAPQLPLAKPPGEIKEPRFRRRRYSMPEARYKALKKKALQFGTTPTLVLLSAFAQTLSIWSKSSHFALNLTVFNRLPLHPQVNELIGDFTSLTMLEIDYRNHDTFLERVQKNQRQLLMDMNYRYYSGIKVTRDLANRQSEEESANAVASVVFTSLLNNENTMSKNNSLVGNKEDYSISQTPQIWLDHQVMEINGELVFNWDVVEELFEEFMIDDMFDTYCTLLNMLAMDTDVWTGELFIGGCLEKYRHFIASEPMQDSRAADSEILIGGFLKNVQKDPEGIAVITDHRIISYRELNQYSDLVAHEILDSKTEAEVVAVIMDKGFEQIAAAIGILKAKKAYLPIDASLPEERIKKLLKLCGCQQGFTNSSRIPEQLGETVISTINGEFLKRELKHWERAQIQDATALVLPDALAYVIFTSGSTGTPKGVMISHRGAVNTIRDVNERYGVVNTDRVLALSSMSFDLSVYDVFGMLSAGGALVLPPAGDKQKDPSVWEQMMTTYKVTIWNTVPALMKMLTEYSLDGEAFKSLRLVLMSGDYIPLDLPEKIWNFHEDIRIISLGGATEASIWSILYPISKGEKYSRTIPYGKEMNHQRIYVLNEEMILCPPGVPGQIYIGGMGLAKGYWQDEKKTKDSFVCHPYTKERIYRTGDYGRYRNDGVIEFLGREDNQVKVGGHRIELGEIEAAIRDMEAVLDAVVFTAGAQGEKQLVACVVPKEKNSYGVEVYEHGMIQDPVERLGYKLTEHPIRFKEQNQPSMILLTEKPASKEFYKRRTYREFSAEHISFQHFSAFLGALAQERLDGVPFPKYMYGSGGGAYAIQTYVYAHKNRIEGIAEGLYYYQPQKHGLIPLDLSFHISKEAHSKGNRKIFENAAFSIFLVGRADVAKSLYGNEGISYMQIETGLVTKLLEEKGMEQMIGLCQIGNFEYSLLDQYVSEDNGEIKYLHCLLGGKINEEHMSLTGLRREWKAYEDTVSINEPAIGIQEEIKSGLSKVLPSYMVPTAFLIKAEIPLSENGKVDKKQLFADYHSRKESDDKRTVSNAETQTEVILTGIFQKLLDKEAVDTERTFFELGGDSIMIVSLFRELEKKIKKPLKLADLFKYPSIRKLGAYLDETAEESGLDLKKEQQRAGLRQAMIERKRNRGGGV